MTNVSYTFTFATSPQEQRKEFISTGKPIEIFKCFSFNASDLTPEERSWISAIYCHSTTIYLRNFLTQKLLVLDGKPPFWALVLEHVNYLLESGEMPPYVEKCGVTENIWRIFGKVYLNNLLVAIATNTFFSDEIVEGLNLK